MNQRTGGVMWRKNKNPERTKNQARVPVGILYGLVSSLLFSLPSSENDLKHFGPRRRPMAHHKIRTVAAIPDLCLYQFLLPTFQHYCTRSPTQHITILPEYRGTFSNLNPYRRTKGRSLWTFDSQLFGIILEFLMDL
jgi:hypothetical protein